MNDVKEIIHSIRAAVVPHHLFEITYRRFLAGVSLADEATVVALVGPTRVGKTTLIRRLLSDLTAPVEGDVASPVIMIEAKTTDRGFISTKHLIEQSLVAIRHPFHVDETWRGYRNTSEGALNLRLCKAIKATGVRYLIVDEAHHLTRTKSTRSIISAIDTLKCLCNETRIVLVLVGGYEILEALFVSAHFNGRLQPIDFPNYDDGADNAFHFDRILATLDEKLPWRSGQSLTGLRELILEGSCGCYGLLLQWTKGALSEMWARGDTMLDRSHYIDTLQRHLLAPIRREISSAKWNLREFEQREEEPRDTRPTAAYRSQSRRPFQRNPVRDPVIMPQGAK